MKEEIKKIAQYLRIYEIEKVSKQEVILDWKFQKAQIEKEIALVELRIDQEIAFDSSLKNDTQRKTAKQEKLNLDLNFVDYSQKIMNLDKLISEKEIEVKKVQVEIDFLKRLYEIEMTDFSSSKIPF